MVAIGADHNVEDAVLSGMPSSYTKNVHAYEWARQSLLSLLFVRLMEGLICPQKVPMQ